MQVQHTVVSSAEHGVPQDRERSFTHHKRSGQPMRSLPGAHPLLRTTAAGSAPAAPSGSAARASVQPVEQQAEPAPGQNGAPASMQDLPAGNANESCKQRVYGEALCGLPPVSNAELLGVFQLVRRRKTGLSY